MTRVTTVLRTCILVLGLFLQLAKTELRLELVQVILRHGERTPRAKEMYPNDLYNTSAYEPWGLGQLTNQGKMREYRIGKMLRERYNNFLGDIYRPEDLYAVSTDIDRTKMSLQLVLAALYPSTSDHSWNANLSWNPIPTHYMPERVDTLMKPHLSPVYDRVLEEVRKTKEVGDEVAKYSDLYKYLSAKTGLKLDAPHQVAEVFHLLTAQKNMNLTLPEWCSDKIYDKIKEVVLLDYKIRSYTTELKRLNGGMLIKRFIKNMAVNGERRNPRKMYLYSGHEVNVAAVARAHNFVEPKLPAYGSAILFEKLRDKSGKLHVQMLLWTGVTEQLIPYKLGKCGEVCPIEKYLELVKDVIPSEEEENGLWDYITKEELRKIYENDEVDPN